MPETRADLLERDGVGEYTAKSVLAHSFGADATAVDTNVERLLSRFFDLNCGDSDIAEIADEIAPRDRGSDFLHAMLDFAAAVCTAKSPDCEGCTIERNCDSSRVADDRSVDE